MQIAIPTIIKEYSQLEMPDKDDLDYYLAREGRVFYIEGAIYREMESDYSPIAQLIKTIININIEDAGKPVEERKHVTILLDSPGGSIPLAFSLCDVIQSSVTPVYTVALSDVMSAAFLIFLSGHKRFIFPHSQLLTHSGRVDGLSGTSDEIEAATKNYKDTLNKMKEYILARTKIDPKLFAKNQKKDWYILAEEAVNDYGIADKIITDLSEILE